MISETDVVLRAAKIANIIKGIVELYKIPVKKAMDLYYNSVTAQMIEEGVADLHCRSDKYLAILVWEDMNDQ